MGEIVQKADFTWFVKWSGTVYEICIYKNCFHHLFFPLPSEKKISLVNEPHNFLITYKQNVPIRNEGNVLIPTLSQTEKCYI